jgi:DNA repair protein RadC
MTMPPKKEKFLKQEFSSIKKWNEDDRPRERLIKLGASSLSDSELIAILIGNGTVGRSAVDISRNLLAEFGSVSEMAKSDIAQFQKIQGIGLAKSVTICAAFELSRRIDKSIFANKIKYTNSNEIASYYLPKLRDLKKEVFRVLLLDTALQFIKDVVITEGIIDQTLVHPREVFRPAIVESASSIVLIHNHPSGNTEPSEHDKKITNKLVETGKIIGIRVIDHIIIGRNDYYSFVRAGLIN